MAEEKKRLTAAELRKQQEERERLAREAEAKAAEETRKQHEANAQAALRKVTENLKATWYDDVVAVSQKSGIRFLVLARVVGSGKRAEVIDEICAAIQADEYDCDVVNLNVGPNDKEGEVSDGKNKGWKPAHLPSFGSSGGVSWLIVKW